MATVTEKLSLPTPDDVSNEAAARSFVETHERRYVYNELVDGVGTSHPATDITVESADSAVVHTTPGGYYLLSTCRGSAKYYDPDGSPRRAGRNAASVAHFVGSDRHRRIPFNAYRCAEPVVTDSDGEDEDGSSARFQIYDFETVPNYDRPEQGGHALDVRVSDAGGEVVLERDYRTSLPLTVQPRVTRGGRRVFAFGVYDGRRASTARLVAVRTDRSHLVGARRPDHSRRRRGDQDAVSQRRDWLARYLLVYQNGLRSGSVVVPPTGFRAETPKSLGNTVRTMPSRRPLVVSLAVGVVHAVGLLAVALYLGYTVGPTEYSLSGAVWRYGGLVVVATLPVWLALRYRLATPLVALAVTTGYVLGVELTPPGPTFRDVAELERLAEPTGITVVEDGLYIVRYMVNASVWTVGFLFLGLVEYVVRSTWPVVPSVERTVLELPVPAPRRRAVAVATTGGVVHAAVMVWFAARLGVTISGDWEWALYLFGTIGMWVLAAVPLYLLVRHRLVAPATLLTLFVLLDVWSEFAANVEGPHALYFGGWFLYLSILLVAGGVEYGLRRIEVCRRFESWL
ncbi:hypothetical protein [Haloplanus salilacus]|uniref:hypothetical protein n=1 Tax=Haloplanus salilacus TaxID=2949994 RepID=UPI0030D3F263